MAPKTTTNASKQTLILTWLHNSGTAYTLKDLERALPSVASISGMQVKDYVQSLVDESLVRVEKIGTGNWYWSFPSEGQAQQETMLASLQQEHARMARTVADLQTSVAAEQTRLFVPLPTERKQCEPELDLLYHMLDTKTALEEEIGVLKTEIGEYSANARDSDEGAADSIVQGTEQALDTLKRSAEKASDDICGFERFLKDYWGLERDRLLQLKRDLYGDQFDEEEDGLRDLGL